MEAVVVITPSTEVLEDQSSQDVVSTSAIEEVAAGSTVDELSALSILVVDANHSLHVVSSAPAEVVVVADAGSTSVLSLVVVRCIWCVVENGVVLVMLGETTIIVEVGVEETAST